MARFAQFNAQTCPIVPQLIYFQSSLLSRRSQFISPFTIYWAQSKMCWRPYIIPLLELNQSPLPSWFFCFPHSYWFRLWRFLLGFFCAERVFSFSSCKLFSPVKTMWKVEHYWQVSFHGLLIPVLQRCCIWFSNYLFSSIAKLSGIRQSKSTWWQKRGFSCICSAHTNLVLRAASAFSV